MSVGVSCHDFSALRAASDEPWVDVLLARLNYQGDNMDAKPDKVVPVVQHAYERGKGVIAMKVLGCGTLTSHVERAIRFVFGLGSVHAVTIGPTDERHIRDNIKIIESVGAPQERLAG